MSEKIERLAELRELLVRMERDLGLGGLSRFERDLFYAIRSIAGESRSLLSSDLREHPLVAPMTQPTFHRALRTLIDRGLIRREPGERARYTLIADLPDPTVATSEG